MGTGTRMVTVGLEAEEWLQKAELDTGQQDLEVNCMSWVRGKGWKDCSAFLSVKCT